MALKKLLFDLENERIFCRTIDETNDKPRRRNEFLADRATAAAPKCSMFLLRLVSSRLSFGNDNTGCYLLGPLEERHCRARTVYLSSPRENNATARRKRRGGGRREEKERKQMEEPAEESGTHRVQASYSSYARLSRAAIMSRGTSCSSLFDINRPGELPAQGRPLAGQMTATRVFLRDAHRSPVYTSVLPFLYTTPDSSPRLVHVLAYRIRT